MTGPTVSVVMPAYNRGSTIDAALASVKGQIRPADEIVIVDDRSDDDTAERVERWVDQLPIRLIRNEVNVGCGAARARAVAEATGDVIAPLDGDDVWLPDHLSSGMPLTANPKHIVATRYRRWQPNRGMDASAASARPIPPPPRQATTILHHNFLFSGSLAWRSSIMAVGGGSLARRADDWETWIRLIIEGGCTAIPAPHTTVLYRAHDESLSVLEGCLPDEIALCEKLLGEPAYAPYAEVLRAALDRRLARREFLDGSRDAAGGDSGGARLHYRRALRIDPSLRGIREPGTTGSVAVRALLGLASPRLATSARRRVLARKAIITEHT